VELYYNQEITFNNLQVRRQANRTAVRAKVRIGTGVQPNKHKMASRDSKICHGACGSRQLHAIYALHTTHIHTSLLGVFHKENITKTRFSPGRTGSLACCWERETGAPLGITGSLIICTISDNMNLSAAHIRMSFDSCQP